MERTLQAIRKKNKRYYKVLYFTGYGKNYWLKEHKNRVLNINLDHVNFVKSSDHYCKFHFAGDHSVTVYARLKNDVYDGALNHHDNFKFLGRSLILNTNNVERIHGNEITFRGEHNSVFALKTIERKKLIEILSL